MRATIDQLKAENDFLVQHIQPQAISSYASFKTDRAVHKDNLQTEIDKLQNELDQKEERLQNSEVMKQALEGQLIDISTRLETIEKQRPPSVKQLEEQIKIVKSKNEENINETHKKFYLNKRKLKTIN